MSLSTWELACSHQNKKGKRICEGMYMLNNFTGVNLSQGVCITFYTLNTRQLYLNKAEKRRA